MNQRKTKATQIFSKTNSIRKITNSTTTEDDPLKILKARYAKGEITTEQYDEMKDNLL